MDIFGAIAIALLLLLGRDQIKASNFTIGTFMAFIVGVFKLYDPVRKFALFNNSFQQALGASSSIFDFMDVSDEVKERPDALILPPFHSSISFRNVSFSYGENGEARQVLRNINLEVRKGGVGAFVGSRAARSTTLAIHIPRLFDVSGGSPLIDGQKVRDFAVFSLRSE